MRKNLIFALICMALGPAHAQFKDGNQLHSLMQEKFGSVEWFNAMGYVTGVADTLTNITICGPKSGVPASQIYDIVKQYLQENPSIRHLSADRIVNSALSQVFPCQKKGGAL